MRSHLKQLQPAVFFAHASAPARGRHRYASNGEAQIQEILTALCDAAVAWARDDGPCGYPAEATTEQGKTKSRAEGEEEQGQAEGREGSGGGRGQRAGGGGEGGGGGGAGGGAGRGRTEDGKEGEDRRGQPVGGAGGTQEARPGLGGAKLTIWALWRPAQVVVYKLLVVKLLVFQFWGAGERSNCKRSVNGQPVFVVKCVFQYWL